VDRRHLLLTTAALGALSLAACGDKPADAPAASTEPAAKLSGSDAYALAATGHGFTTGAMMAANTVYVFFDPTCPHCAVLWGNAKPLQNKLKMVWMPIGLLQRSSAPQGATILFAADPVKAMEDNEASVMARGGGITANSSIPPEQLAKIQANTELFKKTGADSVPLIVYKNGKSGTFGTHAGAVSTEQLASFAGL
jgi:thiol:disulfide interchange protein DsbG